MERISEMLFNTPNKLLGTLLNRAMFFRLLFRCMTGRLPAPLVFGRPICRSVCRRSVGRLPTKFRRWFTARIALGKNGLEYDTEALGTKHRLEHDPKRAAVVSLPFLLLTYS